MCEPVSQGELWRIIILYIVFMSLVLFDSLIGFCPILLLYGHFFFYLCFKISVLECDTSNIHINILIEKLCITYPPNIPYTQVNLLRMRSRCITALKVVIRDYLKKTKQTL